MSFFRTISTPILALANHGHLLKEFVRRDIKDRFAGSIAGGLWSIVNPLISICVYLFIFSTVLRIQVRAEEVGTNSFFIYFLSAFLPWIMFSEAINRSTGIIIEHGNLIKKVVFPVELLPTETIISAAIMSLAGFAILFGYLALTGYFSFAWGAICILAPLFLIFLWGLCCFLSAICVFIRDVKEILGLVMMVWFYATPIIYPISMVPEGILRGIISINPLTVFISSFRQILLEHTLQLSSVGYMLVISIVTYMAGAWFFERAKPAFGDVL